MNRKREEAIELAVQNVVAYTKDTVTIEVEDGEDDFGTFVTVVYQGITSSKYYYTY